MQPKGKKLPKWFWIVGLGAAIVIGLYLRSRSQSSNQATNSQQTSTPTDVTSNPYYYTASGAYPDTNIPAADYYGASPYGMGSFTGGLGLPSGFDPTSFEEGITYAQQSLGSNLTTPVTTDAPGTAAIPTPVGSNGPASITLNISPAYGKTSGKPTTSSRAITPHPGGAFYNFFKKKTGKAPPNTVAANNPIYVAWQKSLRK